MLLIGTRKSAFTRFLVERWQVVASLFHHFYHTVERDAVASIRQGSIEIGVQSARRCKGIALYTRYLNQSADRVAGHSKVVLQPHLSGILHL